MEILVVIVVFAVGILAVMQIFPRGFQILMRARDTSVATNLARDEIERLKARSDQLPDQVLSGRWDATQRKFVIDGNQPPTNLGPASNLLAKDGTLDLGVRGTAPWQQYTGANRYRVILGEGGQVASPMAFGNGLYGRLRILQFNPVYAPQPFDPTDPPMLVYGKDLIRRDSLPSEQEQRSDSEFFVTNPNTPNVTLWLPQGPTVRRFRLSFTAYTANGTGFRTQSVALSTPDIPSATQDVYGNYPLYEVSLKSLDSSLQGVEYGSIRAARQFLPIDPTVGFSYDPSDSSKTPIEAYEYMPLDPSLGVLLFSPAEDDDRTPLTAKVDYEVLDWRILHDEFRVPEGPNPQHRLAVGHIKVGGMAGPDGLPNNAIWFSATNTAMNQISDAKADNLLVQDLETGGILAEVSASTGEKRISVDKSLGILTFYDADPSTPEVDGELLLPGASSTTKITLTNRPLRVLYQSTGEWSVQLFKAAAVYAPTYERPAPGSYYVGASNSAIGGSASRIYFSPADAGRRITIDEINFANGGQVAGQSFQIAYSRPADNLNLPCVDLSSVLNGQSLASVRGVRGASITVRVLHNPASFSLTNNSTTNIRHLEEWGRNWSRRSVETFIQRGDEVR